VWRFEHASSINNYLNAVAFLPLPTIPAVTHAKVAFALRDLPSPQNSSTRKGNYWDMKGRLRSHYKAIARHLRRAIDKTGHRFLRSLCKADWNDRSFEEHRRLYQIDKVPLNCFAYVTWRMQWESLTTPSQLLRKDNSERHPWFEQVFDRHARFCCFRWDVELEEELLKRIDERVFVTSCFYSFKVFLLEYIWKFRSSGRREWLNLEVGDQAAPAFILKAIDSARCELHWFMRDEWQPWVP
jgi:hypothetical protein